MSTGVSRDGTRERESFLRGQGQEARTVVSQEAEAVRR